MVVPPKHPKMIIFSGKTHGYHFRKPPYSSGIFYICFFKVLNLTCIVAGQPTPLPQHNPTWGNQGLNKASYIKGILQWLNFKPWIIRPYFFGGWGGWTLASRGRLSPVMMTSRKPSTLLDVGQLKVRVKLRRKPRVVWGEAVCSCRNKKSLPNLEPAKPNLRGETRTTEPMKKGGAPGLLRI